MDDLEGATTQAGETGQSSAEVAMSTEPKVKPTVNITETEEFRQALDKALGKSTVTLNQQVTSAKAETGTVKAELEFAKAEKAQLGSDIEALEAEIEKLNDDPDALRGFRNARAQDLRNRQLDLREKQAEQRQVELDGQLWAIQMRDKADELQEQYSIPREPLEACSTAEQMERMAKALAKAGETREPKSETAKFDSGGGADATSAAKFSRSSLARYDTRDKSVGEMQKDVETLLKQIAVK